MQSVDSQHSLGFANGHMDASERFSWIVIFLALGIIILHIFLQGNWFLGQYVENSVIAPFSEDVSSQDGAYNLINTTVYAILLLSFVIVISGTMGRSQIVADERFLASFIPWIIWASSARVLEDSGFFIGWTQKLYISPLIHFHTAFWVAICLFWGTLFSKQYRSSNNSKKRKTVVVFSST